MRNDRDRRHAIFSGSVIESTKDVILRLNFSVAQVMNLIK